MLKDHAHRPTGTSPKCGARIMDNNHAFPAFGGGREGVHVAAMITALAGPEHLSHKQARQM